MTDCLETPTQNYPPTPARPEGEVKPEWIAEAWAWINTALGISTVDRKQWGGEHRCILKKAREGAIR